MKNLKVHVLSDQQEDGGFKHYVVFGEGSPIDAEESNCVECASEKDAYKLQSIVSGESLGDYYDRQMEAGNE